MWQHRARIPAIIVDVLNTQQTQPPSKTAPSLHPTAPSLPSLARTTVPYLLPYFLLQPKIPTPLPLPLSSPTPSLDFILPQNELSDQLGPLCLCSSDGSLQFMVIYE